GDGTFGTQRRFAAGTGPASVAVGDVNGDGRLDLVTANYTSNDVSVLLGTDPGSFQTQQTLAVGPLPLSVAVADVNGDGRLDLVLPSRPGAATSDVSVLLGTGDGTFGPLQQFGAGMRPSAAVVGDVNGDGRPDLITNATFGPATGSVLLGK